MLTSEERQIMIDQIRTLPSTLEELTTALDSDQLQTPCGEGEWSIQQIVHHMAECHMNDFVRLKSILTQDTPTLQPFDPEAWGKLPDAETLSIDSSMVILMGLHLRWATLLDSLSESDWGRTALHPNMGQVTIDDLLKTYAGHGVEHIAQISKFIQTLEPTA